MRVTIRAFLGRPHVFLQRFTQVLLGRGIGQQGINVVIPDPFYLLI